MARRVEIVDNWLEIEALDVVDDTGKVVRESRGVQLRGVSDADHVRNNASRILDAMLTDPTGIRCGHQAGKKDRLALCAQRRVLAALHWIQWDDYAVKDIKAKTTPAVKRLQKALGVKADGAWGQRTNAALDALLKETLGKGANASASKRVIGLKSKEPDKPDEEMPPIDQAGFPWWIVVGGVVVVGAGGFAYNQYRKRRVLSGY